MGSSGDPKFNFVFSGLDIGGDSCRICVYNSDSKKINLQLNKVSNRQTPNLVSFDKRLRLYGEEADARITGLFKSTIPLLSYTVGLDSADLKDYVKKRKYVFGVELDDNAAFKVQFNDEHYSVTPLELYSFLVNKLLDPVRLEFNLSKDDNKLMFIAISVPLYFNEVQYNKIQQSLSRLGFGAVKLIKETECLLKRWCDAQLPDTFNEFTTNNKDALKIAFLDVGFVHTTFFIAQISKGEDNAFTRNIIREEVSDEVGTYQMAELMCDYVYGLIKEKRGYGVQIPSKQSYAIYKSCMKALKDLSVLNDTRIDIDLMDDDFNTILTRSMLEDLTKNIKSILLSLLDKVLDGLNLDDLMGVEMLGGGSRIPFVKSLLEDLLSSHNVDKNIRVSMDSTSSLAHGAVSTALDDQTVEEFTGLDEAELQKLLEREEKIQAIESEEMNKRSILNEIDDYLIRLKNDATGEYSNDLSNPEVEETMKSLEDFSLSAIVDNTITSKQCLEELEKCKASIASSAPTYIELLEKKKEELKRKDEEESLKNAINSSILDSNPDVKLPKSSCIKRAQKNKEEGNVLIATNVELAANHYMKAIQYCLKVSDAQDEESKQLNDLKLACYLNLSMCYIKMDTNSTLNKAISATTSALDISPGNPKALYRRAFAYEKLNELDKAASDLEFGLDRHPDNQDMKIRNALYLKDVNALTHEFKVALFFAQTATSDRFKECANYGGTYFSSDEEEPDVESKDLACSTDDELSHALPQIAGIAPPPHKMLKIIKVAGQCRRNLHQALYVRDINYKLHKIRSIMTEMKRLD